MNHFAKVAILQAEITPPEHLWFEIYLTFQISLSCVGYRTHKRTHLFDTTGLYMTKRHRHHHRYGEANSGLHLRPTTDIMLFKSKAVIDTVIDPFQR